ncbi:unnamed protein product [Ranitomeya imitator]|uniref:Bcl-2 Bcl-2 homology region 1-3 domain-containing protein n=1 Tax=Ranitomeya imitator TaxID=111125 RepID=A0ABN9L244_9NEOB|nr:unnamed protein product [Ranitomeya imitator]
MEMLRRSSVFAAEVLEVFDRSPTDKELVAQGKALCRDYIQARLQRAGLGWSKPEHGMSSSASGRMVEVSETFLRLGSERRWGEGMNAGFSTKSRRQRLTVALSPAWSVWSSVGTRLPHVCHTDVPRDELEYMRPAVYRNIARQLNISLASESVLSDAFLAVAAEIFSAGITWGKVVSLYAVAAGLAVDCVKQSQPALVLIIVDCLGEFVRKTLVTWLKRRGGWVNI